MKNSKKILSLVLTLLLVLSLAVPALATSEGSLTGGSITIKNAVSGQTYKAYQILYIESYNATTGAYAYKANSAWETWLKTQTTYVSFDAQGYVTWVKDADAATFAKLAQAEAAKMSADASATCAAESTVVTFSDLKLGYYLVDTTLGTLCSLDTTNPNVEMTEKNAIPTLDKQVKEDSTNQFGDENTAQIGDTVEFKTTIHAKKGAQNYVLHDEMSSGLTLNADSIQVKVGDNTLVSGTDYTLTLNVEHKNEEVVESTCTFEIAFAQTWLDSITADTDIVVSYSAVLNGNAAISTEANPNKTKLHYGENSSTEWDETKTYTFTFDIVKTDSNKKLLTGAKFELYDAQTGGNKIALVKVSDGVYRVATTQEQQAEGFTSAVIEVGKATVQGLDANTTYYLEETEAPSGYNKLATRVIVAIENANLSTTMTGDTWNNGDGGIQITNNSGTQLPATGGIGTTILYVLGSVLVLGAIVVLVTRKRMASSN